MAYRIDRPNITGNKEKDTENLKQWAIQLTEQLTFALNDIEKEIQELKGEK